MNSIEIIFYSLVVVVFIQLIFYTIFLTQFALLKPKKYTRKNIAVSVIVCAKNEAENLKTFLPSIINQDYSSFEIVLINDGSNDKTLKVMQKFASTNDNIKVIDVKNIEAFWGKKKYALTLGIKAASHNFLLFTDADCKPVSKHWIKEMSSHFSKEKTIILGYSGYAKVKNSILNKLIRFETLLTAIQYFSFANFGMPYMGVGRNLAYRKDEFFNANGFMSHMDIRSGDDDLFINQIANTKNTRICFAKESFTLSNPEKSLKSWFNQKRRHITTAKRYKANHKMVLSLFFLTQFLFWSLSIVLLISLFKWKLVLSLILLRTAILFLVFAFSTKKLGDKDILLLLPFLELFLVIFQITIFISNLVSRQSYWK
ncbi:MAG TPA: glycosyltransferase [Flavobacteriaceae bacterium]|nr:glycosyltransferase [Flavobacteriaceae bacterium]